MARPPQGIVRDPQIMSGAPCLKGTRIPLSMILAELAESGSVAWVADNRGIDPVLITAALEELAWSIDQQRVKKLARKPRTLRTSPELMAAFDVLLPKEKE